MHHDARELKRNMKEVEGFLARWEEGFQHEDRDVREVERIRIYNEDAWFEKKGIFAKGGVRASRDGFGK